MARGPILTYGMPLLALVWGVVLAGHTIFAWVIGADATPSTLWYIVGILDRVPTAAFILFLVTWMTAETRTKNIFTDLAVYAALNSAAALVLIAFAVIWYWDLAIGCGGGTVKAIEKPMCKGDNSIYVWVNAAVYILLGIFDLIALAMTFADLYYRRLQDITKETVGKVKKVIPKKLRERAKEFRSAVREVGRGGSDEGQDGSGVMENLELDASRMDSLMSDNNDIYVRRKKKTRQGTSKEKRR